MGPRLEAALELAYRARRPVLLEGATGIGKSEIVQAVAHTLGIETRVLDLSLLEPPDLVGLPVIADGRTTYAVPSILPHGGAGILMLEELNRAERYIQQPALQLLTARRLHEYELPPDWVCFAAINPESGDYQVTPLDRALRARFMNLSVRADRGAWLAWATTHGIHPAVIALAQQHDRVLDDVPPRTWTQVSHVLGHLTPAEIASETLLRDVFGGYLPAAWCELLLASRDRWTGKLDVDMRDLLARYSPGSAAAETVRGHRARGETDRLDEIAQRVLGVVRGPEVAVMAERGEFTLASFEALLADLPGDHRERLQEALARNPTASALGEIAPLELLQNFANSAAEQRLKSWRNDPLKQHRIGLSVTALRAHLEQHPKLAEVRRSNIVRINLGLVLSQLPERHAMPLVETLLKLGITPVKPG
ncbi:MAG: MoxR family ATPase [Deltaproteobacteria bacterium]